MTGASDQTLAGSVTRARERRRTPFDALAEDAEAVARACHAMAVRFHAGGKVVVFGNGGPSTDAQHVSVEFVHPVIVGKRALPAMSLTSDAAVVTGVANRHGLEEVFAHQLRYQATPDDIAVGISWDGNCRNVVRGLEAAGEMGLLTIGLVGSDGGEVVRQGVAEHALVARSDDPLVVKELHVTMYHILWELVHVFFEHPGALSPQVVGS